MTQVEKLQTGSRKHSRKMSLAIADSSLEEVTEAHE